MRIALVGKICAGKSTLAQNLAHQDGFVVLSFAKNVKYYAAELFGIEYKDRRIIQEFAQKMREIQKDIWIRHLDKEMKQYEHENIVIDDLRFEDEYVYLKEKGFKFVKLEITPEIQAARIKDLYKEHADEHLARLGHVSETQMDSFKFDFIVKENECYDNVYLQLIKLFR